MLACDLVNSKSSLAPWREIIITKLNFSLLDLTKRNSKRDMAIFLTYIILNYYF